MAASTTAASLGGDEVLKNPLNFGGVLGHIQHPLAEPLPRMLHFSPRSHNCHPRDFSLIVHVKIFTIINISLTYLVDLNPQFHSLMLKKKKKTI